MTDLYTPSKRSWVMRQVRSGDTRPEVLVRRVLHARGYRFRLRRDDLPGKPDIVLTGYRTVIFVHGCFWHNHACARGSRRPKSNVAFWATKLDRNVQRDRRVARELRRLGWCVVVVWECQTRDLNRLSARLCRILKK